jgi:hypothetical protein
MRLSIMTLEEAMLEIARLEEDLEMARDDANNNEEVASQALADLDEAEKREAAAVEKLKELMSK